MPILSYIMFNLIHIVVCIKVVAMVRFDYKCMTHVHVCSFKQQILFLLYVAIKHSRADSLWKVGVSA